MPTFFEIRSSSGNYSVSVQNGALVELLRQKSSHTLIVDEWFAAGLREAGLNVIFVPAEESSKSLDAIPAMIVALRKAGAHRKTKIIAIGGGIVQDATCFIASIYMRGVEWEYLPTTLLAMVDSCIGGKSSINVGPYKNLVGTFHPPTNVRIDPSLVKTLPTEAKLSGLLEACKICFCRGDTTFGDYLSLQPSPNMSEGQVQKVIELSLSAKKWFIEIDEFDQAERLLLNFGHTFGHAIEGASNFRVAHGIAVGIGMLCALELGRLMGRDYSRCKGVSQLNSHVRELLGNAGGLAGDMQNIAIPDVLNRFEADKKHGSSNYSVIVVSEAGTVELAKLSKTDSTVKTIQSAMSKVILDLSTESSRQAL